MEFKCVEGCSDCCIYREYYPDKSYGKIGVLILPSEKERIEELAKSLGKTITILPRIGLGSEYRDGQKAGPKRVIAYQLMGVRKDGDLCPFLDVDGDERSPHGGYRCMIYEDRPLACRAYPLIESAGREVKLDAKCQFCRSCSAGSVEGLQGEIEALTSIQKAVRSDENEDVWRYATGIGNQEDKDLVHKGWILETH
ncbi:MAG: YkgJ family cysteine cluster protein [Nitrososphaerales archaeon]